MKTRVAALLLVSLGLIQIAGDLFGLKSLKGFGALTCASPAPKVFSAVGGLETYSTHFFIEWTDREGQAHSVELTPERYAGLRGPYNRRNVYGAVLAFGPVLATDARTRPMFEAVARFTLCGNDTILKELGINRGEGVGPAAVRLEPLPGSSLGTLPTRLEAHCP